MGSRISLALATQKDVECIVHIKTNPDLWPFETDIQQDRDAMRKTVLKRMADSGYRQFIIRLNDEAKTVIGEFHLHLCDEERKSYEMGYCLYPEYRGFGYCVEAGRLVFQLAFEDLKAHRIFAMCNEHNAPSYRVMEKLGMVKEGVFRRELPWKGGWVDQLFYAIVDHEYFGLLSCNERGAFMPLDGCIDIIRDSLTSILADNSPTVYLFGSVVTDDFRLGWSDIDILCLCEKPLGEGQMDELLYLRQALREAHNDPVYRLFEGGILTWDAFLTKAEGLAVYWGTSGQRITDAYHFDPFSVLTLKKHGRLLAGADHRDEIEMPSQETLLSAVWQVLKTIRKHALETDESLYSAGWMLDIARCLYTLDTGDIIAKTAAGRWALQKGLAPDVEAMQKALALREEPLHADAAAKEWLCGLGPYIQRFADVLEQRLSMPYDALAKTWDDNRRIERANVIAQEIKRHISSHCKTAMEFGCGTGLISFCLRDLFEEVMLIDTSEGMIDVLKEKIQAAHAKHMLPLKMDLTKELYQEKKFDVIYSSMVLHHIADTHAIVKKLYGMLHENGCICIVDMDQDDGLFHQDEPGFEGHDGFDQEELRGVFQQQGFQNLRSETFYHGVKMRGDTPMPYSLFYVYAEK